VPSPKVRTYDLQPEMSARILTDKLIEAIRCKQYDLIVINYANGDMVGHSGKLSAAIKAVEVLDECLGRIYQEISKTKKPISLKLAIALKRKLHYSIKLTASCFYQLKIWRTKSKKLIFTQKMAAAEQQSAHLLVMF
jgi:hypothetical protein